MYAKCLTLTEFNSTLEQYIFNPALFYYSLVLIIGLRWSILLISATTRLHAYPPPPILTLEHERIHFFSERNETEISKWISDSVSFLTKYENQNPVFYETKFWKKRNFAEISFKTEILLEFP